MQLAPKSLTALLGAATLVLPVAEGAAATTHAQAGTTAKKKKVVTTKKLKGQGYEASRWGTVQVNVTVRVTKVGKKKKSVRYVDLGGTYSYHSDRSQYIMSQALPLLRQEFLSAQSANVQMISGATNTSEAFIASLQSALSKLKV